MGIGRLVVVWVGLERWLPESRLARVVALFTAAVIPVGVQLDGMVTNETLSMLLCALAIVAAAGRRRGRAGWTGEAVRLAGALARAGAHHQVLGVGAGPGADPGRGAGDRAVTEPWRPALRVRWKPFAVGAAIVVALSGWFFVRNQILYGRPAPTGYEGILAPNLAPYEKIPYLSRRPPAFYWQWDSAIFSHPYVPTGYRPQPRFFPVLVASTFSDYYSYCLAALETGTPVVFIHHRPVPMRRLRPQLPLGDRRNVHRAA